MAEIYTLQGPKRNPNHQPSPANYDNDRYTPMPDDNFNEPVINDQPIESPYPTSDGRPEFYHLKTVQDHPEPMRDDQPFQSTSPPMNDPYSPIRTADGDGAAAAAPELYHLGQSDDNRPIPDRRPPSEFRSNNRVSPMPYEEASPAGQERPELYYIQAGDEPRQRSPSIKKTTFNDQPIYIDNQDRNSEPDEQPGKVTLYVLKSPDGENRPPPFIAQQRTPSPPIRTTKKQQQQPAVAYDVMDDDSNKKYDVPPKRRPFPTALNDVSTNIRYVPLSPSKASESIQRSMNKYRFGGN